MKAGLALAIASPIILWSSTARADYSPPAGSAKVLQGVSFQGEDVGLSFRNRFRECDTSNTCDGKELRYGCSTDKNNNKALMRLRNGVIFFEAKMALDTDGAPLLYPDAGHQPETSLQYDIPGNVSFNSDRVPFIVIPLGGFGESLGVKIGDVATIVHKGSRVYGVVADQGPKCKIGEGSIKMHEKLGHKVCLTRGPNGDCTKVRDVGIDGEVLYFIFPNSKRLLFSPVGGQPLQPSNVNERIQKLGESLWKEFTTSK
jgi:hypothetical protein